MDLQTKVSLEQAFKVRGYSRQEERHEQKCTKRTSTSLGDGEETSFIQRVMDKSRENVDLDFGRL